MRRLTELPIDFLAFQVVGKGNAGFDFAGKFRKRPRFPGRKRIFADIVLRRLAKAVFRPLSPTGVEVDVEVHAFDVGFPQGKVAVAVDCQQVAFALFVADKTDPLLTKPDAVGVYHRHKVDASQKGKLRIFHEVFGEVDHQQRREMLTGMYCALNNHVVAVFLPYKNVGNLLSQFAVADVARFHTVSAKKLHFVKQVAVPEQKKPPLLLLYVAKSQIVTIQLLE